MVQLLRVAMAVLLLSSSGAVIQNANAQCDPPMIHFLMAPDGEQDDYLGYSVDVSGTRAIAGAWGDDDNAMDSGAAYLFSAATGTMIAKLLPADGQTFDYFGWSVALGNGRALVGAHGDNDNGDDSGSVYVFDAATGVYITKFLPDDGMADDSFAVSVAADGAVAIIGAPGDGDNGEVSGSAYLFDIATGTQLFKLLPDDGAAGDQFGFSVSISGTTAIVGSRMDGDQGESSGSAYLFDVTTGNQITKLLPDDGAEDHQFGTSVAISGTTAIIAAPRDSESGFAYGSAYLFDTVTENQLHKLQIVPGDDFTEFGISVAINGSTALIGARLNNYYGTSGEVHLFDTTTGNQFAQFDYYSWMDDFGGSVACDGLTMMVGASQAEYWCGAAYLYGPCPTVGAEFTCLPSSGTVPFITQMTVSLHSFAPGQTRRAAGRINFTLASGAYYSSWRAGYTNLASTSSFISAWNQNIPSLGTVIGDNLFELVVEDVTPAPYNQPPFSASGDTATANCTVTGVRP